MIGNHFRVQKQKKPFYFYLIKFINESMTLQISNNNERILLVFVLVSSISISIPFVLEHASHLDGILYPSIHAVGFVLASFLATVTMISWRRTKIPRMIFSSSAFGMLAIAQGFYMYFERSDHSHFSFEGEIFDIMIVGVTVLFAVGIFYKH